jgi:hypothetical protein
VSPRKRSHARSKLRKLTMEEELSLAFGWPSDHSRRQQKRARLTSTTGKL